MKIFEKVHGSKDAARELIVDENNIVYVHSNVRKLTEDELKARNENLTDKELADIEEYEYDEIQYTKEEYIEIMSNKNKELEDNITELEIAITELYEGGII